MDKQQNLDLAGRMVELARRRKIKDCKVSIYEQTHSKLAWRDGRLEETSGASIQRLTIGLYRDGRSTWQTTSDLRPAKLEQFLDEAAGLLALIPPDPWQSLPDPALQGKMDLDLETCETDQACLDPDRRRQTIKALYDRLRELDAAVVEANSWSYENQDMNTVLYSTGFSHQQAQTWLDLGCTVTMLAPDGSRPSAWYGTPSRRAARLGDPETLAQEAIRRCRRQIGQSRAPSGDYDIVLSNENASWILGPLVNGISGEALDQKSTIYEGKRGQAIASSLLTLRDDPFIRGWYNSRVCDWEGFPARRRDLVYRGVLQDYLIDWYHSRKLGLAPTTGSVSNMIIEPGDQSLDQLLAGMERGILVHGFNGGNDNPVTGDFSVGISGDLVEQGRIVRPVNEMLASGNFRDLLVRLDAVGNDPCQYSGCITPSLRFRQVRLAGS